MDDIATDTCYKQAGLGTETRMRQGKMFTKNMEAIEHIFGPLTGKTLLDIGCGRGGLLRALSRRGAVVTGVDPNPASLVKAQSIAPDATLFESGGEALPFEAGSFDGAIMLNSFHHVPDPLMRDALAEAYRVIRPGCRFAVIEPLARGGYQEVFAPIDDETEIRATALAHLDDFIAACEGTVVLRAEYDTWLHEDSVETVLSGGISVDPTREAKVEVVRDEVVRLFSHHARETDGGYLLDQPMVAVALEKPA